MARVEVGIDIGFALAIQQLPGGTSQVLVLGELAGYRNEDGWFAITDIRDMFEILRVPAPDVQRAIRQLVDTKSVVRAASGKRWSLTPAGRQRARGLMGDVDSERLAPQLAAVAGADFGHARHTVIPPGLAPIRWQSGIRGFLDRFPFDTNVFCMTRFPDRERERLPDPVGEVVDALEGGLRDHGLTMHLASDRQIDDDLWGNVAAHAWACRYGIGLFEDRVGEGINHNLTIEIGSMLMTGRRCALLKDVTAPDLPTDLIGQIFKPIDFDNSSRVSAEIHRWAAEDLGLGACSSCP